MAVQENFMPFFSELGYDTWAISLRGQGTGDRPPGNKGNTLKGIAKDVSDFVRTLDKPPIVLAHSFGGLAMLRHAPS
jgi:pimeloyl-ACP methyl ester carboxylesterase